MGTAALPITFTSDDGEVNYEKRTGTLKGNVVITQGTLTIKANRSDFRQNADNSLSATAHGNPVAVRQKRDGVDEYYEGYAQRIEYDGAKELVELFDRALLKRGQDEIRSNYISYNAATEIFKAEGRAPGTPAAGDVGRSDRVRGTMQMARGYYLFATNLIAEWRVHRSHKLRRIPPSSGCQARTAAPATTRCCPTGPGQSAAIAPTSPRWQRRRRAS